MRSIDDFIHIQASYNVQQHVCRAESNMEQNSSSSAALLTIVYGAHSPDDGISHPIDVSTGMGCSSTGTVEAILKRLPKSGFFFSKTTFISHGNLFISPSCEQ